jgi:CRISPR-associated protein (TIGR03984 family)
VTFTDALAWAGITGPALLSTPTRHLMASADATGCQLPDGPADLSEVYHARVFDEQRELRWWHDGAGLGRAVVLAEDTAALANGDGQPLDPVHAVDVIDDGGYLLWGHTTGGGAPGWTALATTRIGTLHAPLAAKAETGGGRVRLAVREYVAVEPVHGNAYVAEERLLRLHHVTQVQEGQPS